MGRLVVISNRTANLGKNTQIGGLAVGIVDALKSQGGLWAGWDGSIVDGAEAATTKLQTHGNVTSLTTALTSEEHEKYYLGFANKVLWPAFHYRLDLMDYRMEFVDCYSATNEKFAEMVSPHLRDDDVIWVHDYHLIPMAAELRKQGCKNRIGFFLHIPFPSADIFSAVPRHEWLRYCLLQFDLIGFQTINDVHNFHRYLKEHSDAAIISPELVRVNDRTINIGHFPHRHRCEAVCESVCQNRRYDRTGAHAPHRSETLPGHFCRSPRLFERPAAPHEGLQKIPGEPVPEYQGHADYLQIASPSREDVTAYSDIKAELEQLAGAVNGKFADFNWAPIQYINRNIPREKLAPLFGQV